MSGEYEKKLERLRYLLDCWSDIWNCSFEREPFGFHSAAFESREPGRLTQMAKHETVKELDRCLRLLSSASPGDYRHLQAFRFGAEWRGVDRWARVKLPSGRYDYVKIRDRERVVPKWLKWSGSPFDVPARVVRAELFLCRVFKGEVFMPDEFGGKNWQPPLAA